MTTCVPIRDMKNTAAFTALVESSEEPITVTKNGYDTFVVMKASDYKAQFDRDAHQAGAGSGIGLRDKITASAMHSLSQEDRIKAAKKGAGLVTNILRNLGVTEESLRSAAEVSYEDLKHEATYERLADRYGVEYANDTVGRSPLYEVQ